MENADDRSWARDEVRRLAPLVGLELAEAEIDEAALHLLRMREFVAELMAADVSSGSADAVDLRSASELRADEPAPSPLGTDPDLRIVAPRVVP